MSLSVAFDSSSPVFVHPNTESPSEGLPFILGHGGGERTTKTFRWNSRKGGAEEISETVQLIVG